MTAAEYPAFTEERPTSGITFLFVGERPSQKAIEIGATWQNAKLAGRTLRDALAANNIPSEASQFVNLWTDAVAHAGDTADQERVIAWLTQRKAIDRFTVVALGNLVSACLSDYGVEHLKMVHPAARGKIRKREVYQAHVGSVLAAVVTDAAAAADTTLTTSEDEADFRQELDSAEGEGAN